MVFKIKHLHIKALDPQKTAKWWVENLGAKITKERPEVGGYFLDLHGVTLNITPMLKRGYLQKYGLEHLAIGTDDVKNVVEKLKAAGARLLYESKNPKGYAVFFFEIPDGVLLELIGGID